MLFEVETMVETPEKPPSDPEKKHLAAALADAAGPNLLHACL